MYNEKICQRLRANSVVSAWENRRLLRCEKWPRKEKTCRRTKCWNKATNDSNQLRRARMWTFRFPRLIEAVWTHPTSQMLFRLEICRDRRDRRLCKIVSCCVIFSRKQRVSFQNLRRNMRFTHIFGKFTHTFPKAIEIHISLHFTFNKNRTKIINADIYAVLLLAKKSKFTHF